MREHGVYQIKIIYLELDMILDLFFMNYKLIMFVLIFIIMGEYYIKEKVIIKYIKEI